MTDYAIRIIFPHETQIIQNEETQTTKYKTTYQLDIAKKLYDLIHVYLVQLTDTDKNLLYLISPIEISEEKGKPHIHIYLKTNIKKDTIVKYLKRNNLVQTGNSSFSFVIIRKKSYKSLEEAIHYYIAYCRKTGKPSVHNLGLLIVGLPKWISKKEYLLMKSKTFKEKVYSTYEVLSLSTIPIQKRNSVVRVHIIKHLLNLYKEEKKIFSSANLKMYANYLLLQYYPELIEAEQMYCEYFKNNETGIF